MRKSLASSKALSHEGEEPKRGKSQPLGCEADLEARGVSVLQQFLLCSLLKSLLQHFSNPEVVVERIPKCSDSSLFFCSQQEVADLGIGLVQGKFPARHGATPASPSRAALAPGRLGNCEDFSEGQSDSRMVRRMWWISSFSSQPSHHLLMVLWMMLPAISGTSLIPTNSNPISTSINSLLFPRSPPLSQAHQDVSTGSGCTQGLPVRDLLLSQLQAHEHRVAGKPQLGVEVDRGLCLCLAPQGGLEERGIQFCLEIHGKASPGREKHVGSGHRAVAWALNNSINPSIRGLAMENVCATTRKGWTHQEKSRELWKSTLTPQVFPFPEPGSFLAR